jgi:hypothetical protein
MSWPTSNEPRYGEGVDSAWLGIWRKSATWPLPVCFSYAQVPRLSCLAMMRLVSSTVPKYDQKIQLRNAGS